MPPVFTAPQYIKATNPKTGVQETAYKIDIQFQPTDELLSFIAESSNDVSLQSLQKCVVNNLSWWNSFINTFLNSTSKYFSKPYTVDHINKIAKHTLNGPNISEFPVNISLTPSYIQISGAVFMIYWSYTTEKVLINIPDLNETEINTIELPNLPASNTAPTNIVQEGIEELNIDEITAENNSTGDILELDSPAKFYEKQRVKEARLKAKLAVYKAQRQMAQYYEKYGDDISDSETDSDLSDEESEEEVQL